MPTVLEPPSPWIVYGDEVFQLLSNLILLCVEYTQHVQIYRIYIVLRIIL